MHVNRTAPTATPVASSNLLNVTGPTNTAGGSSSLPASDLQARGTSPGASTLRTPLPLPASSSAAISAHMDEVTSLLNAGGTAVLQQGARNGFESLPQEYRGLAMQTAGLVGIASQPTPAGAAMPFPALASRLGAVTSASSQLAALTQLDMATALHQEPAQRAATLEPQVAQLKEATGAVAAAIQRMPVAELRANRELVKEKLSQWTAATEAIHTDLKAQFGDVHPLTVAALEARTAAAAASTRTLVRMAVANLGEKAYNMTVGAVVSAAARFFGSGN